MTLSAAPPAFAARRLTKRFGRTAVLKEIDLDLDPGRCHVIFGRNGAGKSTLLLVAATLIRPSSGEIFYDGTRYEELGDHVRSGIGLVSHQSFLYPDLSVLENLEFFGRLYGIPSDENRIEELLVWADLELRRHSPARSLSRGMLQRLALARALLHRPKLVLLDEPYSGLDEPSADRLSAKLHELKAHSAILLTTHEVERGVALGDRVLILESGRISFDATGASPAEVRRLLIEMPEIVR